MLLMNAGTENPEKAGRAGKPVRHLSLGREKPVAGDAVHASSLTRHRRHNGHLDHICYCSWTREITTSDIKVATPVRRETTSHNMYP